MYPGWAGYCASKAAVDQLTRVVAVEEAAHGLRAYAVAPGMVDTAMQERIAATTPTAFPAVERFMEAKRAGAFKFAALGRRRDPRARVRGPRHRVRYGRSGTRRIGEG